MIVTGAEANVSAATVRAVYGYQAVIDALRREIYLGRIRPGERLPAERQLSQQLGVSRETVRQAIRVLEGSGQLVIRRGALGGAFVQESAVDRTALVEDLTRRSDEILALTEYRGIIESGAAALAAVRRTNADVALFHDAQASLRAATSTADARHADTRFHLAVAAASGNAALAKAIEEARVHMFGITDVMPFEFLIDSSATAHDRVIAAISAGDGAAASHAMREHIDTTRTEFLRLIEDSEEG